MSGQLSTSLYRHCHLWGGVQALRSAGCSATHQGGDLSVQLAVYGLPKGRRLYPHRWRYPSVSQALQGDPSHAASVHPGPFAGHAYRLYAIIAHRRSSFVGTVIASAPDRRAANPGGSLHRARAAHHHPTASHYGTQSCPTSPLRNWTGGNPGLYRRRWRGRSDAY